MSEKTTQVNPSMLLITAKYGPLETFKLIPTSTGCPFIECIYDAHNHVLAIVGKDKKDQFHLVPRLDDDGNTMPTSKKVAKEEDQFRKQRVSIESYQEYYITEKPEIISFIENFAVNASSFDFKKTVNKATMADPSKSGIEVPGLIL